MSLDKVWNDDDVEYREVFKGREVVIPPRKFIEMNSREAAEFMGRFVLPKDTRDGTLKVKKLRRERAKRDIDITDINKGMCIACGKDCGSQMALTAHIKAKHPGLVPVKEKKDGNNRSEHRNNSSE